MKLGLFSAIVFTALSGSAMAQTTTAPTQASPPSTTSTTVKPSPTVKPMKTAKTPTVTTKVRSEKSIACSADADKQQLHGAARKKFRAACKKGKMPV